MSFNQIFNLVNFSGVEFYYFLKRFIKSSFCVYLTARKRENRHFHVVVIQRRQRNVQKSVTHAQSCCSANLNLFSFRRSRCRHCRGRRCLCTTYGQREGTVGVWGEKPFFFVSSSYSQYILIDVICAISGITSFNLCDTKRDKCPLKLRSLLHSRFLCRRATLLPTSKAVIGWVTVVRTPSRK